MATVAVTDMAFLRPVKVGDVICCYTDLARVGRTSLTLHVEAWVLRQRLGDRIKVTSADFTYVALDGDGKPRPLSLEAGLAAAGLGGPSSLAACAVLWRWTTDGR